MQELFDDTSEKVIFFLNITFDKDYPYEVGKPIKIYPNVSGGSSNYKYKYFFC